VNSGSSEIIYPIKLCSHLQHTFHGDKWKMKVMKANSI